LITSPHVQTNKIRLNQTCQQLNLVTQSNSNQLNSNENICNECWIYWKKYGGFKTNQFELNYNSCKNLIKIYYIKLNNLYILKLSRKNRSAATT
jgi:hypothetical protein